MKSDFILFYFLRLRLLVLPDFVPERNFCECGEFNKRPEKI